MNRARQILDRACRSNSIHVQDAAVEIGRGLAKSTPSGGVYPCAWVFNQEQSAPLDKKAR